MRSATRVTVSTFGALAGVAGIEHGIGEVLQGNIAPAGLTILSWPGSEAFRSIGGEPAMTIVPNLLVTGILAILFSLIFLVWATMFVQRKHGGVVMILLSIVMLLAGAGFGPPVLGVMLGVVGTRVVAPVTGWRARPLSASRRFLGKLWPWSYVASLIVWLFLFPGSILLSTFISADNVNRIIPAIVFAAFGFLLLTIFAGLAYDAQRPAGLRQTPSIAGTGSP